MQQNIENLLQQTLVGSKPARPMYSISSHVIVAFFGGPFGLLFYSLNSIRYSRLLKRWWLGYLVLFAVVLASQIYLGQATVTGFPNWIPIDAKVPADLKIVNRIIALLIMGFLYLLQKRLFTISELKGESPKPWIPAIISSILGFVFSIASITGAISYAQ